MLILPVRYTGTSISARYTAISRARGVGCSDYCIRNAFRQTSQTVQFLYEVELVMYI